MTQRKKNRSIRSLNFLPEHICSSFETELDTLIGNLASSGSPKALYLQSEYKSKYLSEDLVPADDRRAAALLKWKAAEERNRTTNQRLLIESCDFGWTSSDEVLSKARQYIASVLGNVDSFSLSDGSFSNGASTRVLRGPTAAILKHSGQAHVTSSAISHWILDSSANSRLSELELNLQESSVFFTVPKATDIDRVACKEPEINLFMQREVGVHIRRRLKFVGIDLLDQTNNQYLASMALKLGLATIDLSSASDSITTQLVVELLPPGWFMLLNDLRVKSTDIDGTVHPLEMFSSMGNGFTFELESLIFWALSRAVCYLSGTKGKLSVYGDDIIISSLVAPRLARVFSWFGFKVNPKKSNWSGPLRESCGKHYHNSWDITPFYLKRPVNSKIDVIRVLNRLLQWSSEGTGIILDTHVLLFHLKWSKSVPRVLHGGDNPEMDNCLVTEGTSAKMLTRATQPMPITTLNVLSWWLTTVRALDHSRQDEAYYDPLLCVPVKEKSYLYKDSPDRRGDSRIWFPYLLERYLLTPHIRD